MLIRVGIDQAFGGWNAPCDPQTLDYVYVPIPEGSLVRHDPPLMRTFDEVRRPLERFQRRNQEATEKGCALPASLDGSLLHLDPDFEHCTYGDDGRSRGKGLLGFELGDWLVFYAGLRPIRACEHKLVYALIGLITVERVRRATDVRTRDRHRNAHTRKLEIASNDVVIGGNPSCSGRFERCIPIGEFRDRAYRVRPELLRAWGGLSVKDGYIQRSAVPPSFHDPSKLADWLRESGPTLLPTNW